MKRVLLLGSSSQSRQMLLRRADINFTAVGHMADEAACSIAGPLPELVAKIARAKMDHAVLPEGKENEICFVLTADTLSQDPEGQILGKPVDHADAIAMLKLAQKGFMRTGTAFCLDKKVYRNGVWHTEKRIEGSAQGDYIFHIPDHLFEDYFEHSKLYLAAAGAIAIEDYGIQYFKEMHGSFTAIVGLPMYELFCALQEIGFFET